MCSHIPDNGEKKIYEIDLLTCLKYTGATKDIGVIENLDVIKKILRHLGLCEINLSFDFV